MFEYSDLSKMLDCIEKQMQLKNDTLEAQSYNWGVRTTVAKIKELLTYKFNRYLNEMAENEQRRKYDRI